MSDKEEAIQLLSGSRRKLDVAVPGENKPIYIGLVFLVIIGAVFFAVNFYLTHLQERAASLDDEMISLDKKRDKKFEQEALVWNKRLSLAGGLIKNHVVWSEALRKVEALTPAEIQFMNFHATLANDRIELKAIAPSYTVIARSIAALTADAAFTDVALNKITSQPSGLLEYDMTVTFSRGKLILGALNKSQ